MGVLDHFEPKILWQYFEEICSIPHGSGNMGPIGDYYLRFAKEHGLAASRDTAGNIIIVKEASAGYEKVPPLILQGHMDMVCEKTPETEIDFETDGLTLETDGEYVFAKGTTLGGDDGIAGAIGLALLSDPELRHPRLELVLTTDEETGMTGASKLDVSGLKGRRIINLDSEDEGVMIAGCAGGSTVSGSFFVKREAVYGLVYELDFHGFLGGHSGNAIDKGRANSNITAARVIYEIGEKFPVRLISMCGGSKDNVIPNRTKATVILAPENEEKFIACLRAEEAMLRDEYAASDGNITISEKPSGSREERALTADEQKRVLNILINAPNGVQAMSMEIKGLVETSLNMGVLKLNETGLLLRFCIRSSIESARNYLVSRTKLFLESMGGEIKITGEYRGWAYRKNSPLREAVAASYKKLFDKELKLEVIHAGVECGILLSKLAGADCVSIGPQMYDIHTADERLSIASSEKCYRLVREIASDGMC